MNEPTHVPVRILGLVAVVTVLLGPVQGSYTAQAFQEGLRPLGTLLNSSGSLDLTTNSGGALDPTGWRLEYASDGAPIFRSQGRVAAPLSPTNTWNALGSTPLNEAVYAIAVAGPDVCIGGIFTDAGGNPYADLMTCWDGTSWGNLDPGLNDAVYAIAVAGANVYVGGTFTDAGGGANYVARWEAVVRCVYLPLVVKN